MKCKHYIVTSDRYSFLLEGFVELWKRHWNDSSIDIVILGYDPPKIDFPKNFEFYSMGVQSETSSWSDPLDLYFSSIDDEYFFMTFEDHYLVADVDIDLLNEAESYISSGEIDKVYSFPDVVFDAGLYKGNFNLSKDQTGAELTYSLMPGFWRREFFLRLLKNTNSKTPHGFELNNNRNLNCKTIYPRDRVMYSSLDAVRKGKFDTKVLSGKCVHPKKPWFQIKDKRDIEVYEDMYRKWNV